MMMMMMMMMMTSIITRLLRCGHKAVRVGLVLLTGVGGAVFAAAAPLYIACLRVWGFEEATKWVVGLV